MLFWILLFVVGYFFIKSYINSMFSWRSQNVKQGIPVPFFGDFIRAVLQKECQTETCRRLYNRFKNVRYSGAYQMTQRTLIIHDPELIKQLTVKDFDHFVDHTDFAGELEPLWSKNLFALKGHKWSEMRATLSPSFTASKMRLMFELMEKSARQYVDFYTTQNKDMIELELKDSFTRFSSDVIGNCAFGVTVDSLKEPTNDFYRRGKEVTNLTSFSVFVTFMVSTFLPKLAKLLNLRFFPKETTDFFKTLIRDTLKIREEQNIVRPDMINQLIEARKGQLKYEESTDKKDAGFATMEESEIGKSAPKQNSDMTIEDMAAQVLIFFFAGFDTTSTLMSFACYELAVYPEIQEKLRKEIDDTAKANNEKLTYDILNKMKYMDMVVTETLRKNPPFAIADRVCTKPYTIQPQNADETPVNLYPGDVLWIPVAGIHSDEQHYPSPDKFDPERFSDENKDDIKPYTFLSFGSGPRNCIGSRFALMEVKTILYHILRNFELVVVERTVIPIKLSKNTFSPCLEGGFWIGFKRRNMNKN